MDEKAITKIRQQFTAAVFCGDEKEKKLRLSIGDLIDKYSVVEKKDIEKVRPWCHEDFLSRLKTFQLAAAWFAKPSTIGALECARHGWCNSGIDELKCHSCGITIVHTKDDHNGTTLRTQLCTGHLAHCGWNENFCSMDFLRFPAVAPSTLQIDFLVRLRALVDVLTLTFTRSAPRSHTNNGGSSWQFDVSESIRSSASEIAAMLLSQGRNTPNRDDHSNSTASSSSAASISISGSDSRIIVVIDADATGTMTTSAQTDSVGDDGVAAASICPIRLHQLRERAMTAIDTLSSRWTAGQGLGGENASYTSTTRLGTSGSGGGTFLDDMSSTLLLSADFDKPIHALTPDDGDLLGHVASCANRAELAFAERSVLRACVLLALCGWMPVTTITAGTASTNTTLSASTPIDSTSVGNGTGSGGHGSSTASCSSGGGGGDGGSDNVSVSLRCYVCGRTFPMTCFLAPSSSSSSTASHGDPLSQHRAFCLWACSESINDSHSRHESTGTPSVTDLGSSLPGWLHCAHAMTGIDPPSSSSTASATTSSSSFVGQRQLTQQGQSSSSSFRQHGMDLHTRTNAPASTPTFTHLPMSQDNTTLGINSSSSSSSSIGAEQAYKKIKLVLDMATTTTKPNPNRSQPY